MSIQPNLSTISASSPSCKILTEEPDVVHEGLLGESHTFTYQEGRTIVTDTLGRENIYEYDKDNYFTSKINPLHQKSTLRYDNQGQLTQIEDITGQKSTFSYDDATGVMTSSSAGTQSTQYIYHKKYHKPIIAKTDAGKHLFAYDSNANLIHETLPNKKTISYQRDIQGNPVEIIDALGGVSTFAYNPSGNLTKHTNPRGDVTTLSYDDNENLIKLTDIYGDTTHYSTDKADNLVEVVNPNGKATHFEYDVEVLHKTFKVVI